MLLKRYLPRSLLVRSLLIIGAPLIIVQFISIWVFYDRHVDTITRRLTGNLAGDIAIILNHLRDYPKQDDRTWILGEAEGALGVTANFIRGGKIGNLPHRGADSLVGKRLKQSFSQKIPYRRYHIDLEFKPKKVRIMVEAEGGVLEIVTTIKRLRTITTDLFVMWSIGSTIVLLIIAALFMRNQVRPIGQLAHAADSFGKGRDVPGFKPWGAQEVRRAATAFIIMRERIRRQMQQRTEMLAGISHDLRTPLTRLKLQLTLLGDSLAAAETRQEGVQAAAQGGDTVVRDRTRDRVAEDIRALQDDIEEMQAMVEEYLSFAKGEGREQAVETNLADLLQDIAEDSARNGQPVELSVRGTPVVPLRPGAFRRAMHNLIANAHRFGDTVSITARRQQAFVTVAVEDDGPGIPEAQREEVFRPFVRLEHSRNRESGGAGLGLTIARDIIRGHGGDVMIEDSRSGGARVVVRLPI